LNIFRQDNDGKSFAQLMVGIDQLRIVYKTLSQ
jgi:hypothetical protein